MENTILLLCACCAVLFASGCAYLRGDNLPDPDSDEGVAALASSRLNGDSLTARSTLSVSVERGTATLYGVVPDQLTRQRAVQILEGTPGIYSVRDHTRRQ